MTGAQYAPYHLGSLGTEGKGPKGIGDYSKCKVVGFKIRKGDASFACGRRAKALADVRAITTAVGRFHHHLLTVVVAW